MSLALRVVGAIELSRDGRPVPIVGRQQRHLLAALALAGPNGLARRSLPELLWEDSPMPGDPEAATRVVLSRVRRCLAPEVTVVGRDRLRLDGPIEVDVLEVSAAIAEGGGLAALRPFAGLVGQDLVDGDDASWLAPARAGWSATCRRLVDALLAEAERGVPWAEDAAEEAARALVQAEPLSERAASRLIRALEIAGDRAAAILVYEQLRLRLRDDLGVGPSATLRAQHARLLGAGSVALAA